MHSLLMIIVARSSPVWGASAAVLGCRDCICDTICRAGSCHGSPSAEFLGDLFHGPHPVQLAFEVAVHFILSGHVCQFGSPNVNAWQIHLAQAGTGTEAKVSHPFRVDAHDLEAHAISGDVVRGGNSDSGWHQTAVSRSVAFHALPAIQHSRAPERLQPLRGERNVHVGLAHAAMIDPFVIPVPGFFAGAVQRRAQGHVLERKRGHHGVMRFEHGRADDEGFRVQEPGRQPGWHQVQVAVQNGMRLKPALLIQIHQADLQRFMLRPHLDIAEIVESFRGVPGGGFGDDHRPVEARPQKIQDAMQGIHMGRGELVVGADDIGFDHDVLFGFEHGHDLVLDRHQRLADVLAPAGAVRDRDHRAATGCATCLDRLGWPLLRAQQGAGSREGRRGPEEIPARESMVLHVHFFGEGSVVDEAVKLWFVGIIVPMPRGVEGFSQGLIGFAHAPRTAEKSRVPVSAVPNKRGLCPFEIPGLGEQDDVHVLANLRRAVEDAGLPAHEQRLDAIGLESRKDLSDRGRDQGCLPWTGIGRTVPRCAGTVPTEPSRARLSIRRATVRKSCRALWSKVGTLKSRNLMAFRSEGGAFRGEAVRP